VIQMNRSQALANVGAKWLDEHHPDWYTKIDEYRLNMGSPSETGQSCVLCQLTHYRWHEALSAMNLSETEAEWLGFEIPARDWREVSYETLTTAWRNEILNRKLAASID
jgi:hypothetical protein